MAEKLLEEIADYVISPKKFPKSTLETAQMAFADAFGCAVKATGVPACTKILPPWFGEKTLNPIEEAFRWTCLIRWLDYNDTWLSKEWAHPSDNIGALIPFLKKKTFKELFSNMIEAYEIQGILSLSWSCNERGFDHAYFIKIASGAVVAKLMGGDKKKVIDTLSHLFIDGPSLRTYRHYPNTVSRKSWAAADATSRAVYLANLVAQGEVGLPQPITEPKWGVESRYFGGEKLSLKSPLDHMIMDNILFKVRFPIEFHAQTAVEAATGAHVNIDDIEKITIYTHEAAKKIIDKKGPLNSPADRDHCIQYGVAIGLLFHDLVAEDFEEKRAKDPRIDALREKMEVIEEERYTKLYHDPAHRSIPNRLEIKLKGNDKPLVIELLDPIGHPKRRKEALPLLKTKLQKNLSLLGDEKADELTAFLFSPDLLDQPIAPFLEKIEGIVSKNYDKS